MNKFFYKSRLILASVIITLTAFTFTGSGCRLLKHDKKEIAEKKQAKADQKSNDEYLKAVKKHNKNQSKRAQAMMKQTKKDASRYNKPKKRGLFSGTKCK